MQLNLPSAKLEAERCFSRSGLLEAKSYPDKEVFDEVTQGILLTDSTPITKVFPPVCKPPTKSAVDLSDWGPLLRAKILDHVRPQGEEDAVVHAKTVEERHKPWAKGPCPDSLVSRRFGLKQGAKTCLVDDMSASGENGMLETALAGKEKQPLLEQSLAGKSLSLGRVVPAPHTRHLLGLFAAIAQNSLLRSFSIVDSLASRQHSCRGSEELAIRKTARFQALRVGGVQELRATPSYSDPSYSELLRTTPNYSEPLRAATQSY